MGNFWQTIYGIFQNTFVIILTMELIIGNLGNGFLVLVNCMDLVKRKKISLVNQILIALATSRICLLWLSYTALFITILNPDLITTRVAKVIHHLWIITNHFSIWLATCLCIFYFLKIANFSNFFFLHLKWRVKKTVSVIWLVSLVFLFLHMFLVNLNIDVWINESQRNMSFNSHYPEKFSKHTLILHTIFLFVPFGVSLLSFFLLIFSLWTHHKKMQQNVQGSRDARTTAHIKALRTVIAFLLLYTIFILFFLIQLWKYELLKKDLFISFCQTFFLAFPSVHSCVLILGDIKLRQTFLSVFWWLICRPNNMETSGP